MHDNCNIVSLPLCLELFSIKNAEDKRRQKMVDLKSIRVNINAQHCGCSSVGFH